MSDGLSFDKIKHLLFALLIVSPCSFLIVRVGKLACFKVIGREIKAIEGKFDFRRFGFEDGTGSHSFNLLLDGIIIGRTLLIIKYNVSH
jgi:hypothetical protein